MMRGIFKKDAQNAFSSGALLKANELYGFHNFFKVIKYPKHGC